jgi:hypothetical protein
MLIVPSPQLIELFVSISNVAASVNAFSLFLQFRVKLAIFANQSLILTLKFPLVSYVRCARAIGILSYLAPTGRSGVKTTLPAEGSQVCATEGSRLDYSRQLVSSSPLLRCLAAGRHQLAFLLPLMAPAIDGWDRNARATGDLSQALPVWWAHSLKDLLPHSGAIGRFHVAG